LSKELEVVQAFIRMIWPTVDGDFEFVAPEPAFEVAGGGINHFEVKVGIAAAEILDQHQKRRWGDGAHHPELERDALGLLELPRLAARKLGVLVNFGEVRAHHAPELRQMGVGPLAMDELAAELVLQKLDGACQ